MRNIYVLAALAAMLAVSMVCADELEPPWEVRTFIAPDTDGSFTQNMSVVRKQWVCPICGYSTHVAPYVDGGATNYDSCPDPWILGHAVTQLLLATPVERLCGHVEPASGTTIIGRPFHPGDTDPMGASDWDDATSPWTDPTAVNAASYVHVRAAGLYSPAHVTGATTSHLMDSTNAKVRFLVIEPGAVRAVATAVDRTDVNPVDATDAFDPTDWTIHVNPYRVSDGDTWYIRQHEQTTGTGRTSVVTIEVYSKLYGSDFALDSVTEWNNGHLNQFRNDPGCQIISNSGAVRIECPRMLSGNDENSTYVMGFTIRSNTQTLPSPEEVDYDTVAGCGDLYTDDPLNSTVNREPISMVGQNKPPPNAAETWAWADVPFPDKAAWMVPTNPGPGGIVGYVGTDLAVVEKANGTFTTNQCWPYRIPAGAVGLGKVIVQWADGTGGALQTLNPGVNTYYREEGEWYYHADAWLDNAPAHPDMHDTAGGGTLTWQGVGVGNADVASVALIPIGDRAHYYMVDCSFLSTRSDVPRTGDTWATSGGAIETDTDAGSGGYTRVIVAEGADPTAASTVGGEYNPGSSTPDRPFYVANRIIESTLVSPLRMGGSGARFRDDGVLSEGDPDPLFMSRLRCDNCGDLVNYDSSTHTPGTTPCPTATCAGTLQWPVTLERMDADSQVAYTPLEALLVNFPAEARRITLSPEAIRFGPDNSTVPIGVSELLQTVRVDIPKYQPPSVPAGAIAVENDLVNDNPYVGSVLAYTRHVTDPALIFTDGFETHDVATSTTWTQYVGNNPYSQRGALVLEDAGGDGTGTHISTEYAVANTRYTWRAMPRYVAGSGPGQVYFCLAEDPTAVAVGSESRPDDGIWTRFTGYSGPLGGDGDLGAAGGWSVEVRERNALGNSVVTWSAHYQDLEHDPSQPLRDGIENASDHWYEFAIEIGPDRKPKFYYGDRLLGTSDVALGITTVTRHTPPPPRIAYDHAVFLCTRSGDSLVDYVNAESLTSIRTLEKDAQWQAYYVSPNDGDKIPAGLAARMRSGQAGATDAPVAGEFYCPVSDIHYSQLLAPQGGVCSFTGAGLLVAEALPEGMLAAEEYDMFDLLVSVLRKADVASDQRTVDLGWVAPGVAAANPTTTAGALRPGSSAQPSDVSSREDLTLRNEGNVPVLSAMGAGYMFRPEIDGSNRSRARWGQSVPSSVGTLFRYRPATPDDVAFNAGGLPLLRQDSDGAAGMAATARLQAGVRAVAGEPYAGQTMPVPMGQPVGNYTGEMLVFIDLDGDGQLDFGDADVGATSTASNPFDPEVDEPYEPVASFATRMRVVETRLPQNDFYSKDVSPTGIYDVSRDAMQILWAGTRVSAPGTIVGTQAASGTSAADAALPTSPFNVLYANATLNEPGASDPYYRGWLWEAGDAKVLSNDAAGINNTAPVAYVDANNNDRWAMWHRQSTSGTGMASELRFDSSTDTDWDASSFIYGTSGARQGLTGFVSDSAANNHWLFWHGGTRGNEVLRYRWDFDPTAAAVNDNEAALPVSNAVARGSRQDATYEEVLNCAVCGVWYDPHVFDPGDACTVAGCGGTTVAGDSHGYRKPGHYPFTYTKDPSVFERTSGGRPFVHAFFSGLVRATGNADICWVRFNEERMQYPAANYGKTAFPEVANNDLYMPEVGYTAGTADRWAGEQMRPSGIGRRVFQTRGIDWMISDDTQDDAVDADTTNFATEPDVTPRWAGGYGDPELFVGVVTNSGGALDPTVYRLTWTEGTYERSTGTYIVTPTLTEIRAGGDVDIAIPPGHPHASHLNELIEPSTRMTVDAGAFTAPPTVTPEEWPSVRLRINPASGTVTWSAPLFNPDAPADPRAIFNTDYDADILDVLMYANYTPYVYRVTTDGANDDSPSAFYDLGDSSRLTVFWRRSFGTADTPHFGRAAFMHKTYTTALQVGQPPINPAPASITMVDLNDGGTVPYTVDGQNGIITITDDSRAGNLIRVSYTSLGALGAQTEVHRIVGWSTETPVPVNSVVSEGRLRVVPEIYEIPDGVVAGGRVDVVRYWLLWSSPRATYDVRVAGSDGQTVKQSSDVYCAVVSPEYGSLIREADVPRVGP